MSTTNSDLFTFSIQGPELQHEPATSVEQGELIWEEQENIDADSIEALKAEPTLPMWMVLYSPAWLLNTYFWLRRYL